MKQKSWVKAGEHGWIDLNGLGVIFEDISEDFYGRDVVTFTYQNITYESIVVIGSKPN